MQFGDVKQLPQEIGKIHKNNSNSKGQDLSPHRTDCDFSHFYFFLNNNPGLIQDIISVFIEIKWKSSKHDQNSLHYAGYGDVFLDVLLPLAVTLWTSEQMFYKSQYSLFLTNYRRFPESLFFSKSQYQHTLEGCLWGKVISSPHIVAEHWFPLHLLW